MPLPPPTAPPRPQQCDNNKSIRGKLPQLIKSPQQNQLEQALHPVPLHTLENSSTATSATLSLSKRGGVEGCVSGRRVAVRRPLVPRCTNILPLKTNKVVDDFIKASRRGRLPSCTWCVGERGRGVAMGSLHVLLLLWHEKRKKFLKHFIVSIVEFD